MSLKMRDDRSESQIQLEATIRLHVSFPRNKEFKRGKIMSKKPLEMIEGRQAFNRFRDALKAAMSVPKSALPPRNAKPKSKRKKTT